MPATVDSYIAAQEPHVAAILEELRRTIHAAVPEVTEEIKYAMPAFRLAGTYLIYVAAWKSTSACIRSPSAPISRRRSRPIALRRTPCSSSTASRSPSSSSKRSSAPVPLYSSPRVDLPASISILTLVMMMIRNFASVFLLA